MIKLIVTNSHRGPYSTLGIAKYGKRGDSGGESRRKSPKSANEKVIAARRREGRSYRESSSNSRKLRVQVNWDTDKDSGITSDCQKQPGPWNRKLGCLIVRDPMGLQIGCDSLDSCAISDKNRNTQRQEFQK